MATTEAAATRAIPAVKAIRQSFSSPIASLFVLVLTVVWTIPTVGLLITSLRPARDVAATGWWTFFVHPGLTLDNYQTVLFQSGFGNSGGLFPFLINSLAITIPGTIFPVTIAAMAAYALAWMKFRGSDTIFFIIFALQVVPLQMALIPLLQLFSGAGVQFNGATIIPGLNLGGSYLPVWIAHTMFAMPLAIFLLHNFIAQLPGDLMEAATVDGAGHFRILQSIVLPLSLPALASFAIFQFLWVWNDLLVALLFVGPGDNEPITVGTNSLIGRLGTGWELVTAGGLFSMVVPVAIFLLLQRYFVRGLTAGAVKG